MFPTEVISLPSKGKFYPPDHPLRENGGKLKIKYMTAKEEDILTSTNLIAQGIVIDKLLESLIVEDGVKYTSINTGDILAVMIASRVLAYGKNYSVSTTCPECEYVGEYTVDISQLQTPDELVEPTEAGTYVFTTPSGKSIEIRAITRGDEIEIEKENEAIEKKGLNLSSNLMTSRLKKIVVSIDGITDRAEISKMVENLIVVDSRKIREEFSKVNPSVDMTTEIECSKCGHVIKGELPITADFFWPEL